MWINRTEYQRLSQQVEALQASLDVERAENRRAERWWSNMWLRHMKSFPLPPKNIAVSSPTTASDLEPVPSVAFDTAEMAAVVEMGQQYGVDRAEAERLYRQSKGITA
jgi:hypothetical protein